MANRKILLVASSIAAAHISTLKKIKLAGEEYDVEKDLEVLSYEDLSAEKIKEIQALRPSVKIPVYDKQEVLELKTVTQLSYMEPKQKRKDKFPPAHKLHRKK